MIEGMEINQLIEILLKAKDAGITKVEDLKRIIEIIK